MLENLPDLEAEWAVFMEDRAGGRNKWTQDQRWRADNPGELASLVAYRESGAPRPALNTATGRRMVEHVSAYLKAKGTTPPPPPPGVLRYRPPGWNGGDPTDARSFPGYEVRTITGPGPLNLDNAKDYYLEMGSVAWSSVASGRSYIGINGGRNVVLVGGEVNFNRTNATDDMTAFLLDGGDPNGQVYFEGLDLDGSNGITVRTKRKLVLQNSRVEVWAYNYQHSNIHPDIVQVWGAATSHVPCKGIYMHKATGLTSYTGLVNLVEISPSVAGGQTDPLEWVCDEVNIRPRVRPDGTKDAGAYAYHCSGPTGQTDGPYTVHKGDVYAELPTGGGGAYTRPIDGIVCLRYIRPDGSLSIFPYEIRRPDGTVVYTSPDQPTGGNGPFAETTRLGNYLTFSRVPALAGRRWFIGNPPDGDFCPAGVPGAGYVSPGYA